jgi:HlyD family secretion protein
VTKTGFAVTGIVVGLLAISVSISGCGGGPDSSIAKAPVGYGAVTEIVEAPASVTPKAQVTVSAPAAGSVAELLVADGQQVTAGQPLLRIDSPAAQGQLASAKQADAQAAASSSSSSSSGSTIDFSRTQSQADSQAKQAFDAATATANQIADPTLKQAILDQISAARTDYAAASADVRSTIGNFNRGIASASDVFGSLTQAQRTQTKAAVAIAQQTVDSLTVKAPISGALSLRSGSGGSGTSGLDVSSLLGQLGGGALGSQLANLAGASGAAGSSGGASSSGSDTVIAAGSPVASGAPLLVVTDASTLTLTAQVDETSILKVAAGTPADVQLDAIPGAEYRSTVLSVDSQGQAASRGGVTYRVRLSLAAGKLGDGSAAPTPRPGMSAVVDLKVADKEHVLAVPSAAIVHDGNQDTVWLVTAGVAHRHVVRLGAQGDRVVEVAAGLAEGDVIVTAGADKVHDGQKL